VGHRRGLVFNLLGHVPEEGETVRFQGLELRAEKVQERRIVSVNIRRLPQAAEATAKTAKAEREEKAERAEKADKEADAKRAESAADAPPS